MQDRIWSQGIARRALLGSDSQNPTLAAKMLLGLQRRGGGARRRSPFAKGLARARRLRRSFFRGNPAPAVVAALAGKLPGFARGLFKTPSEKRAGAIAGSLVASAVAGNLTAAKAIDERQEIGIAKERAVWRRAWTQVPAKIKQLLKQYGELVPGVDHSTPETAGETALARAVDVNELEDQAAEAARMVREERAAGRRETSAAAERREARLTELGLGIGQALAGRGRRPAKRRKKRRTTGRRISL